MKGSGTGASGTGSPLRPVHFNTGKAGCPHDSPDSGVFHSRSGGPPGGNGGNSTTSTAARMYQLCE